MNTLLLFELKTNFFISLLPSKKKKQFKQKRCGLIFHFSKFLLTLLSSGMSDFEYILTWQPAFVMFLYIFFIHSSRLFVEKQQTILLDTSFSQNRKYIWESAHNNMHTIVTKSFLMKMKEYIWK